MNAANHADTTPPFVPQMRLYTQWLAEKHGLHFEDYQALWRWSVTELDAFWQSIWDYLDLQSPTPHTAVLARNTMPGAQWFPGAQVNYAQQVLRHVEAAHAAGQLAIISNNERGQRREMTWPQLRRQVAAMARHLRAQGVQPGDRVAVYLPNIPETMVAFLAVVSLGAIWSVCAPDMGTNAVLDRFKQITPKVLIACDGVTYGAKDHDRTGVVAELRAALPSVTHVVVYQNLKGLPALPDTVDFEAIVQQQDPSMDAFEPQWLPFDHPLWVVYSSGTTGLPKPIVHGHGGILLISAASSKHYDIGCSYSANNFGERFHWYSSTGWIMWNAQLSGLLDGATVCLFDGSPGGSKEQPDWGVLWRFAARHRVTWFGAGAAFYASCMKAGITLSDFGDLRRIRALGSTGSPLAEDVQRWVSAQFEALGTPDIWWNNISGGTDFAGAFIGGHRELPIQPGRMQCRMLGCAVEAWNEQGQAVTDEVGELVCRSPLPSMPLYFWGDEGHARYLGSYFDTYPGVWRHGDWLKVHDDESCIIYGRSDATINRHGLRMGTSELYRAVEALPEVLDALVVDLEYLGRDSYMPLFVVLRPGLGLDSDLRQRLQAAIRTALSPRFVPDDIFQVAEVPRTLSGKKQELPIKKLLLGQPIDKVLNRDAMANPACLDWYIAFAQQRLQAAQ